MGIVINNPLSIPVSEILEQLDIDEKASGIPDNPIYLGGPVNGERGFVLHDNDTEWDSTLRVKDGISVTTSRDILVSIASGTGPERSLIALGYAGWGSGQLEQELADNAWLAVPADEAIIFDLPPEERWNAAAAELGIDLALLSTDTGHA
jgi:putative transcriptional regulator